MTAAVSAAEECVVEGLTAFLAAAVAVLLAAWMAGADAEVVAEATLAGAIAAFTIAAARAAAAGGVVVARMEAAGKAVPVTGARIVIHRLLLLGESNRSCLRTFLGCTGDTTPAAGGSSGVAMPGVPGAGVAAALIGAATPVTDAGGVP